MISKQDLRQSFRWTKIAVTGTTNCGKTMFLTSLLWQLEELDETRFHLPEGVAVRGFHPQNARDRDEVFPLNHFRNVLAREYKWPEKTKTSTTPGMYSIAATGGASGAGRLWTSSICPASASRMSPW